MAQNRRDKTKKKNLILVTTSIAEAFDAAMHIWEKWDSPDGPAVVREVENLTEGRYGIVYRTIAAWGKEAYQ